MRRILRVLDVPRHCARPGSVRQDARAGRRRERHARPGFRVDRDESVGVPGSHEEGAGRTAGQTTLHDPESAGERLQIIYGSRRSNRGIQRAICSKATATDRVAGRGRYLAHRVTDWHGNRRILSAQYCRRAWKVLIWKQYL